MTINIDRAFSWYYQLFPSLISSAGLELKNRLSLTYPGDKEIHLRIIALADYAHNCENPVEKAECLAFAALRASELGLIELGIDLFNQSILFLPRDVRLASVLWCLGWAYDQNGTKTLSYGNWYESRSLITELLQNESTRSVSDPNVKSNIRWLETVLDEMNLHLARIPEEGLFWLHQFDRTGGSDVVKKYEVKITGLINQNRYPAARQEINDLLQLSRGLPDLSRQGAAYLVTALAESEMGNPDEALKLIREGLGKYKKESHEQMCGKWIAGLICLQNPQKKVQARQFLESAILDISELGFSADRFNQSTRTSWYSARKLEMEAVISELFD
ncbi:MAG: hypothetical protein HGA53_00750 [Anaerolineaceae bacterium]|nr:hypothetical protein [Anaerolineaceae bacterium]